MQSREAQSIGIIGAGFTGLSIAYELTKSGFAVSLIESEEQIGGLAGSFKVEGNNLDRFYHHWFTNDTHVINLINDLNLQKKIRIRPTNTGMYYSNNFYKLSTPLDLLKFKPLNFLNRIRLGILTLIARRITDWKKLENITASDWLKKLGGNNVFNIVWKPLLVGKFGPYADDVSAVWFWNKIKLRGGSRNKLGKENLMYFEGGFIELANTLLSNVEKNGGNIFLKENAKSIIKENNKWKVITDNKEFFFDKLVITTPFPIVIDLIKEWAPSDYINQLNEIKYLGNTCLVLELAKSLSSTYWLNVNDPSFPFVGIIEHTNFENINSYGGRHIVYLSKYLHEDDPLFSFDKDSFLSYSIPYIKTMFPDFNENWILKSHLWKARWSQPVIVKNYSKLIPDMITPFENLFLCNMAQIYPEDRGTNYAIREGRKLGKQIAKMHV